MWTVLGVPETLPLTLDPSLASRQDNIWKAAYEIHAPLPFETDFPQHLP